MSKTIITITFLLLSILCSARSTPTPASDHENLCQNVKQKLQGLKEAVEALCGEGTTGEGTTAMPVVRNTWISVPMTRIGNTNLRHAATFTYTIPNIIPSTAKEILIYATMYSGTAFNSRSQHIKIFTQHGESNIHYEKYLYVLSWNQNAYNTNSDNMWFPMPSNRRIYMTVTRDNGRDSGAYLYAIGYR